MVKTSLLKIGEEVWKPIRINTGNKCSALMLRVISCSSTCVAAATDIGAVHFIQPGKLFKSQETAMKAASVLSDLKPENYR